MNPNRFTITVGAEQVDYTAMKFSGGEIQVRFSNTNWAWRTKAGQGAPMEITAMLTDADGIMELVNLVDAARRINPSIRIKARIPYLPYARQDRVCAIGESLALKAFATILNSLNLEEVEVWDVHSDVSLALINNVNNVSPETFLSDVLRHDENYILVAPDASAGKGRVYQVAKYFNLPMIVAEKHRDTSTGQITGTSIHLDPTMIGDRKFLMVDDICDGGRTFIELGKFIREAKISRKQLYKDRSIELAITHCIASKGIEVFHGVINKIYTPNLWPNVILPTADAPTTVTVLTEG